ncbi:MAG: NADH-quinone oxidoreductase subunit NuoH [Fimbriimonadales bacterium]
MDLLAQTPVAFQDSIWWILLRVGIILIFILSIVPGIIWWERRLLSWMQDRIGPNRVGPFGLLQPIADGIKLFFKEDVTPSNVDRFIFVIAPAIALFPAFAIWATLPWGPDPRFTPIADVDIGILYVLAISSLGVYGVFLAGWASNNKYSLLGALRSAAQLVSYELAMGVALGCVILATGSLRMTEVVAAQEQPPFLPIFGEIPWLQTWFIFTPFGLVAGVVFLICMVAETNRAPFDLPEAESELIAGFHTEYSSMKFAVFFMGEYATMMAFSGVFAVMFLGGWNLVPLNFEYLVQNSPPPLARLFSFIDLPILAPFWFIGKLVLGLTFYVWLRATLPRLRYDQLMTLGWKYLLPLAALNFVVVAIWMQFGWPALGPSILIVLALYAVFATTVLKARGKEERRGVVLVSK